MASQDECQHEHVESFAVDDARLSNSEHHVTYLKCVDCGLLTPDPDSKA